jgi:hypothetical protein
MKLFELKINVSVKDLKNPLKENLWKIAMCCKIANGINYTMTITSANDGIHKKGSKHYENNAIDIRTRDMINRTLTQKQIAYTLGKDYDVILESDHIHIEYDPK